MNELNVLKHTPAAAPYAVFWHCRLAKEEGANGWREVSIGPKIDVLSDERLLAELHSLVIAAIPVTTG
jgi:hypothetical protein